LAVIDDGKWLKSFFDLISFPVNIHAQGLKY